MQTLSLDQPLWLRLPAGFFSAPSFAEGVDKEVKVKQQLNWIYSQWFVLCSCVQRALMQMRVKLILLDHLYKQRLNINSNVVIVMTFTHSYRAMIVVHKFQGK